MQLSDREWLARADAAQQGAMLKLLTQGAAERIAADWDFLARPGQRAPAGDWRRARRFRFQDEVDKY